MNLIKMLEYISVKQDIWQHEKKKAAEKQKEKLHGSSTLLILRSIKGVLTRKAVIKKEQSLNHTQKQLSAIRIVSRLSFKKQNILKKNQKNDINKIEAKNSELKNRDGYDAASSSGLIDMEIQGATTIFVGNRKRIIKLLSEK